MTKTKDKIAPFKDYLVSNPDYETAIDNVQLLRVLISKTETKVDFGYQANAFYHRGGWITISPKTFIRINESEEKYPITKASNIPYGPEKLHFKSSIAWRYFSLHFPPLPSGVKAIDLIEDEPGSANDFNFLNIQLANTKKRSELLLQSIL